MGQFVPGSNIIKNPGIEKYISSIDREIEIGLGLRAFMNKSGGKVDRENISRVLMTPLDWRKFCIFSGRTYCATAENNANSGQCYMQLNINWNPTGNTISNGAIVASLHHPLESGCEYRFGIWVTRSVDHPNRLNNATITIQGLRGETNALQYSPEDSFYLAFEISLHEMEVGEYRYYEGEFTALSEDTHLLIKSSSSEFEFDRRARRIHRRCNRMTGGCGPIKLVSIAFDDVSLHDISDCREQPELVPDIPLEPVTQILEFISANFSDRIVKDTATFYFNHDHPYLSSEEIERLREFYQKLDGQIVSIQG